MQLNELRPIVPFSTLKSCSAVPIRNSAPDCAAPLLLLLSLMYRDRRREYLSTLTFVAISTVSTSLGDAERIRYTADDLIANPWQVAYTTAADEDKRVFLQVMTLNRDVSRDFLAV